MRDDEEERGLTCALFVCVCVCLNEGLVRMWWVESSECVVCVERELKPELTYGCR